MMKRGLLMVLLLAIAGCARAPQEVVAYTSVDQVFSEPVFKEFERRTRIAVRVVYDTEETKSTGVLNRLIAEGASRLTQALTDANTPPYVYNGLKREQLIRTGSVVLHELYFANLGGDGKAPADMRTRIAAAFGTFDAWESEFRKIGQGLGGGSGWVVLGYNTHLKVLENYWMADHSTNPPETAPLLVMDMYEHAYQMDYGAAAAKYIDAFFANIRWDAVAKRV